MGDGLKRVVMRGERNMDPVEGAAARRSTGAVV